MRIGVKLLIVLIAGTLGLAQTTNDSKGTTSGQETRSSPPRVYYDVPLSVQFTAEPVPVKGDDGSWFLSYFLYLMNWAYSEVTVKQVEVFDGNRNTLLMVYDEKELSDPYRLQLLPPLRPRLRQIASGRTAVLFVWLKFDKRE